MSSAQTKSRESSGRRRRQYEDDAIGIVVMFLAVVLRQWRELESRIVDLDVGGF